MTTGRDRYILALDCTAPQGSVALLKGDALIFENSWVRGQSHAELVVPAVESLLSNAGIAVPDLSLLTVCTGPGSFTGVRVGVNVVRSFCYAHGIPAVPISSLELWAEASLAPREKKVVAIPAHDGSYFFSIAEKSTEGILSCSVPRRASREEIESMPLPAILADPVNPWPKAQVLAKIALREFAQRQTKDWKAVLPLYVRASSAEEKIGKG